MAPRCWPTTRAASHGPDLVGRAATGSLAGSDTARSLQAVALHCFALSLEQAGALKEEGFVVRQMTFTCRLRAIGLFEKGGIITYCCILLVAWTLMQLLLCTAAEMIRLSDLKVEMHFAENRSGSTNCALCLYR